ncbi:MAG: hypothetical protein QG657_4303 [Acidobacteriota bacterium]|nr:hypothetical protein [Acidobacteriota bacterium]
MPGGDRTGPLGQVSMTGGGFGFCGGVDNPGYGRLRGNRFAGRGLGLGRGGRGLNLRRRLCWEGSESELLRRDAQQLEASLDQVKKRLSELEKQEKKEEE